MKDKRLLLLALVPAALGGLGALLLSAGWLPNALQRLVVFGDRAGLVLLAGVLLSTVLAIGLLGLWLGSVWGWRRGLASHIARSGERSDFYRRLDHELKNPLQAIHNCLANIRRQRLSEGGQRSLEVAVRQVRYLERLIQGLRRIASLPTRAVDMEDLDMAIVVEGAVAAMREHYAAREGWAGDRLVLHLESKPWQSLTVHGDPDLLAQAIHNVIENAVKFGPAESPVEIWCNPDGDWVRVKVIDRGQGIPSEDLPYLGQDLFRGAMARGVPGQGLGLSMVRAILARHHGELQVESRVGQGTAVSLLLPRVGRLPAKGRSA